MPRARGIPGLWWTELKDEYSGEVHCRMYRDLFNRSRAIVADVLGVGGDGSRSERANLDPPRGGPELISLTPDYENRLHQDFSPLAPSLLSITDLYHQIRSTNSPAQLVCGYGRPFGTATPRNRHKGSHP